MSVSLARELAPKTLALQIRLPPATREALVELAAQEGRSLSAMARILIQQGVVRAAGRGRRRIVAEAAAPLLPGISRGAAGLGGGAR